MEERRKVTKSGRVKGRLVKGSGRGVETIGIHQARERLKGNSELHVNDIYLPFYIYF